MSAYWRIRARLFWLWHDAWLWLRLHVLPGWINRRLGWITTTAMKTGAVVIDSDAVVGVRIETPRYNVYRRLDDALAERENIDERIWNDEHPRR